MQSNFFAALNSWDGFKSYYDDVFGSLSRMYIIKGGPGTGKSTLMRKIADEATSRGLDTELYYCSSDPTSLDGVIIPALSIGIADGTAPHVMDASLPGARDEIINLCEYWRGEKLRAARDEIDLLNSRKSAAYKTVFSYLSALGNVVKDRRADTYAAIDTDKLDAFVSRLSLSLTHKSHNKNISPEIFSESNIRVTGALGMYGAKFLASLEDNAAMLYRIIDRYDTAYFLLQRLAKSLRALGCDIIIGIDAPSGDIHEIFIRKTNICITAHADENTDKNDDQTVINMQRFIRRDVLKEIRPKLRRAEKYAEALEGEIGEAFSIVKDSHFALEQIYRSAMDFRRENEYTKKLCSRIFAD